MAPELPGPAPLPSGPPRPAGTAPPDTEATLRRLAGLNAEYRRLLENLDDAELNAAHSLAFLQVADATRRTAHYAMVRAAGAVGHTQAHRLSQSALQQARELDMADVAAGAPLPVNQLLPAEAKPRFRSEVELIAHLADVKPHAARALVASHRHLIGTRLRPARFARLGRQFANPKRSPEVIAQAAARIASLQLRGKAQQQAESRVAQSTGQGQSAVAAELKSISDALSAPDLPEREAVHERCAGLRYRGLGPAGHVWELTCTTVDHELLSTLADRLVNPNLAANRAAGDAFTPASRDREPDAGAGKPALDEDYDDPASVKARRLLHTVLDIVRRAAGKRSNPTAEPGAQAGAQATSTTCEDAEPMGAVLPPMIDLVVTIDYDALRGATDAAGLTSHGQRISATTLRQTAAIAGIIPQVLGSDGEILDYGRRRRLFTAGQARAVGARDRGCVNPGCSMPVHRCEVNHVKAWHRGGKTCVGNGCLLCKGCHMAFHAGHFRIKMVNGVPYVLQSADRDPEQRWRRNWIWHPQAETLAA